MAAQTNVPARITQAMDEKNLVVLKGNVHPIARLEFDQGPVPDAQPLNRMLLLLQRSPDQEATLRQLLDDQQNKSSPNYHAWLTPEQFGKQFGPVDADIQAVTQWLTSHGFTQIKVGPGRTVIEFSGNVGQVRNAFRTEIHRFFVDGKEYTANTVDPQIPAALEPVVAGVVSLHNFPRKFYAKVLGQFRRTLGKTRLEPLFTFPNPSNGQNFYGLGPGDFATIYNSKPLIAAGNDGTGQTIAIVGETNIHVQDVQQFRTMFGLPANFDATNVVLNGEDPGITSVGEEGEADLDVEWSGATAPGATIKFVVSASTPASAGIDLSALYIVEHNLAAVMSESYGDCEKDLGSTGNAFYNTLWEQAAAQGITAIVSSGDGGSAGCDDFNTQQVATRGLAVSGLASTPFNVSLGGTDFDQVNNWAAYWNPTNDPTGTSAKSYIPEIPWSENCAQIGLAGCGASAPNGSVNIVAGSGGPSSLYGKPNWQIGITGMPNDNHRDQPDISMFASPGFDGTGYVYCQTDQTISGARTCDLNAGSVDFGIAGGTSVSAPAFAGIMALVNQKQSSAQNPAPRQGIANYVLYAFAKKAGASCTSSAAQAPGCVFNDVTKGNSFLPTGAAGVGTNSVPCQGGSPNCSAAVVGSNGVLLDPSQTTTEAWTATPGYDMTTGLGTVNANNLATNWGSVSTIPTTTTLTLSPTTGITHGTGENVTVGITVKPNSGTGVPAGDVSLIATFPDGTTQGFDQFTLANGGVTSARAQSLPGGTYNVSAHYAGDGTNAQSDSAPVQVTVATEPSQTFIVIPTYDSQGNLLNGNATSVTYGSRYIIRMYVTDKNGVASTTGPPSPTCFTENLMTCPTGTVSLTANGSPVDASTFKLNNAGYTRDIAPTLTGGTYSLVAQYTGDNSYQASTSATQAFTVTAANTTMSVPYIPFSPEIVGTPVTISSFVVTNVYSGVAPTGTITFYDGTIVVPGTVSYTSRPGQPGALFASLTGSVAATFATSGTHSITAQYSGDASYAAATSSPWNATVLWPTTTVLAATSTNLNYGDSVTVTAHATGSGKGPTMAGQFQFYGSYTAIPGPVTPTVSTDASGNQVLTATITTTPLNSEYVQATYSGDSNFQGSSQFISINVNIPDFSLNIPGTPFTVTAGQPGALQISVVPATNNSSPVTLSCNGNLPIGYVCSLQPSTVNLANGATSIAVLTLSPPSGAALVHNAFTSKRGAFLFPFGANPLWPLSLLSGLAALLSLRWAFERRDLRPSLGFCLVFAISLAVGCGGGSSAGPPPPLPPSGPFATSTVVSTGSPKVAQNTSVTFNAKVTGQGSPTGSVNFYLNGSWYGASNLVAGTASLSTIIASSGIYSLTAQYIGDTNNLGSTSPGVAESVTGSTVFQVNAQTSTLFHSANVTVTIQ